MRAHGSLGPLVVVDPRLLTAARAAGLSDARHWDDPPSARRIASFASGRDVVLMGLSGSAADDAQRLADGVARIIRRAVRLAIVERPEDVLDVVALGIESAGELVEPPETLLRWEPYPLDALPRSIRELAREGAAAIGCDPSFLALAALVACAGAVGLARRVRIKGGELGWLAPSILWAALVAESGERKSPPFAVAEHPLRALEAAARRTYKRALRAWEAECAEERVIARAEKRSPKLPPKPTERRYCARDTTIEALSKLLDENPRGILILRDELSGWFRSWAEYKGGSGSDSAIWLQLYDGGSLRVDRADETRRAYAEQAGASVAGTIQPGTLRRVLTPEHLESGCGARILFAMPPRRRRTWTDATIADTTAENYSRVVRALSMLRLEETRHPDGESSLRPRDLPLAEKARVDFAAWVNELGAEAFECEGAEAASASKIEGGAARLALAIELIEAAEGELAWRAVQAEDAALAADAAAYARKMEAHAPIDAEEPTAESEARLAAADAAEHAAQDARRASERTSAAWNDSVREVSADAMRRGIVLARWHWREARRVLAMLAPDDESETAEDRERRKLVEWIERRGGEVSPADLTHGPTRFRGKGGSSLAEKALDELCRLDLGEWASDWERRPGAPSRKFRLHSAPAEQPPGGAAERGETPSSNGAATGSSAPRAPHRGDSPHAAEPVHKRWGAGAEVAP